MFAFPQSLLCIRVLLNLASAPRHSVVEDEGLSEDLLRLLFERLSMAEMNKECHVNQIMIYLPDQFISTWNKKEN